MRLGTAILALSLSATGVAAQQGQKIGLVDYYGYGSLTRVELDRTLGIKAGDAIPTDFSTAEARMRRLPGVKQAVFSVVCCAPAGPILFVGLVRDAAPVVQWRQRPSGAVRLDDSLRQLISVANQRMIDGARAGEMGDNVDEGHSLLSYAPAREAQLAVRAYTVAHEQQLREVLRNSASDDDRAMAAEALQYVSDKRTVIPDLVLAARDPYDVTRNNAVRSLYAFSVLAGKKPELGIRVPVEEIVPLLYSPVWTDRNKTSMALWPMTESRDPVLLALLKEKAIPPLLEIARWQSEGHAFPGIFILARIAGISDDDAFQAFQAGDREKVLSRVSSH